VPAVAETLPGFRVDGWLAVVAPAGTPDSIKTFIRSEIDTWSALVKELDIQPQ